MHHQAKHTIKHMAFFQSPTATEMEAAKKTLCPNVIAELEVGPSSVWVHSCKLKPPHPKRHFH
jgi:hypothetical protein